METATARINLSTAQISGFIFIGIDMPVILPARGSLRLLLTAAFIFSLGLALLPVDSMRLDSSI
jgi:hypothetical protein